MNEVERVENGAVHEGLGEGARSGFTQAAWEEIRRAYGWPRTCFPLALFAAASWGTWDSFSDGAGDRLYGTFTLLAPVLLVSYYVIAQAWREGISFGRAVAGTVRLGVALPIPLALANGLFVVVAWMFPVNRAAVEGYDGNHYYVRSFGEHLMLTTIGTVIVSACVALLVLILVTLPLLVLRMPADVAAETRLRRVGSARARNVSISLVVCGLSALTLGGLLLAATRGTEDIARTLRDVWRAIQAGDASGGELAWFLGILISATGAAAIAGGIGLFVVARGAGRAESELQPRAESGELDQPGSAHE